jgi:hypothetical protein
MKTNSNIFLSDWKFLISPLSTENKAEFLDLFINYEYGLEQECNNPVLSPIWNFIKSQLDNMKEKYDDKREQLKINGLQGGRPKKQMDTNETKENQTKPNGFLEKQKKHNNNNNENENNNVNENEVSGDKSPTRPPKKTIEERMLIFKESLRPFVGVYPNEMLKEFYEYWTEKNEGAFKFKKEMERTFELSKRLANWQKRESQYTKKSIKTNENGEPIDIVEKYRLLREAQHNANR